ncbi:MAG: CHRD domain-containing protein [Ktedonobacteraceae bacterium]|nr:CHRD domain-containing protein [Ktedonobacteraceae bacterium]
MGVKKHNNAENSNAMSLFSARRAAPSVLLTLLSMFLVMLLAACATSQGDGSGSNVSNVPSLGSTATTPQFAATNLKHYPAGTADLSWNSGDQKLVVKITLSGLAPNSSHAAHIHAGTCAADGRVVYPLNPVVADAKGNATVETTLEHVQNGIPAQGWYVNVHNGLAATPLEHRAISCGNISNPDASNSAAQSVHVVMGGTTAPNESASGKVELITVNEKPAVKITLTGLQPDSTHVAHIHSGSCQAQGAVLVMLNPVVADAHGTGTSITEVDHLPSVSNGLYVNVHLGATVAELSNSIFFNPIACGNISANQT